MPIDYRKYPLNWKTEIRPAILDRAGHCCERCGVKNYAEVYRIDYRKNLTKLVKIVLTIAHLDHDIQHNNPSNLAALCQRCHNRHDADFRKENRRRTWQAKQEKKPNLFNQK